MSSANNLYCGRKQMPAGYAFSTEDYDIFQVIFVSRGLLMISSEGSRQRITPGMLAFLPPGSSFRLFCEEEGYSGFFIASRNLAVSFPPRALVLTMDRHLRELTGILDEETRLPGRDSRNLMESLGELMLALVGRKVRRLEGRTEAGRDPAALVEQVRSVIEYSLYAEGGLRRHLASIPLSCRQLSRIFKSVTGQTPTQAYLRRRLEEAERLLSETDLPIAVIAADLGFSSAQYLSNHFRGRRGITPGRFRRLC